MNLLFLADSVASQAMDVYSKYSLWVPVRSKNPLEARRGLQMLAGRNAFGQMRAASGEIKFGRILVRIVG